MICIVAIDQADGHTRTQDLPSLIKGFGVKSVVADERQNCFVFVQDAESGDVYLNDTQCDTDQAVVCELEVARQGNVSEDSCSPNNVSNLFGLQPGFPRSPQRCDTTG